MHLKKVNSQTGKFAVSSYKFKITFLKICCGCGESTTVPRMSHQPTQLKQMKKTVHNELKGIRVYCKVLSPVVGSHCPTPFSCFCHLGIFSSEFCLIDSGLFVICGGETKHALDSN